MNVLWIDRRYRAPLSLRWLHNIHWQYLSFLPADEQEFFYHPGERLLHLADYFAGLTVPSERIVLGHNTHGGSTMARFMQHKPGWDPQLVIVVKDAPWTTSEEIPYREAGISHFCRRHDLSLYLPKKK